MERATQRIVNDLTEQSAEVMLQAVELAEGNCLLAAARLHARCGLGKLTLTEHEDGFALAIVRLARARQTAPEAQKGRQGCLSALAKVPAASLEAILVIARPEARPLLCDALDWPEARRLAVLIGEGEIHDYGIDSSFIKESVRNCSDPTNGVLDVTEARAALNEAGDALSNCLFRLFRAARSGVRNQITLLEAVAGRNREEIEKRRARRHQISVKAFGLLPLERGEDEALERYLWLQQFVHESNRYGPQQRANEQAAAQVALTNLVQVSGLGDKLFAK